MVTPPAPHNHLLGAIQRRGDAGRLTRHLDTVELPAGMTLFEPGDLIDTVFFMHSGQVTLLTVAEDGDEVGSAAVGREGVVGLGGMMADDCSFTRQRVELAGIASRIRRGAFLDAVESSKPLREMMISHHDAFAAQLLQSVFCQAVHNTVQRVSRWLLTAYDSVDGFELLLTHEALAHTLGVRRATITLTLSQISGAGLVRIERGRIELLDRKGLEALVCPCYRIIRDNFSRVLAKKA